jgi:hypothetical protein
MRNISLSFLDTEGSNWYRWQGKLVGARNGNQHFQNNIKWSNTTVFFIQKQQHVSVYRSTIFRLKYVVIKNLI